MAENLHRKMNRELWRETLMQQAQERGFFQEVGPLHKAIYIPQDGPMGRTLVVAFDNLDDTRQDPRRLPWAVDFISSQGWSSLGLMAHGPTWYRDEAVFDFFEKLARERFFDPFDRVAFYGTSMGGYAACAFSAVVPGATVIATAPQATMDRERAGWDHRYRNSWRHNYFNRFGYAPDMVKTAEKVWLFFDSRLAQDAMHASLFRTPNIEHIRCPFMGHGMLGLWRKMGVLKDIVSGCINGTATRTDINKLLRARQQTPAYQRAILSHLQKTERHDLLIRYCEIILRQRAAPHFRRVMNDSRQALGKPVA